MALSGSKRTLEDRTNRLKGLLCQFGSHQFPALQAKAIQRLFNLSARYGGAKKAAFQVDYFVGPTGIGHGHASSGLSVSSGVFDAAVFSRPLRRSAARNAYSKHGRAHV